MEEKSESGNGGGKRKVRKAHLYIPVKERRRLGQARKGLKRKLTLRVSRVLGLLQRSTLFKHKADELSKSNDILKAERRRVSRIQREQLYERARPTTVP